MDLIVLVFGIIALLVGLLLLVAPKTLLQIGEVLNRMLAIDDVIFSQRLIFGILLLLAGVFMLYRYFSFL